MHAVEINIQKNDYALAGVKMGKEETLRAIKSRMEQLGDLPVFTASVNHICKMSSDPDSDAMSLSQEVLKDANLSVKLLRLANSPYYNRSLGKIGVVSRAIILLGFDTVKNLSLTMKFIESFQNENPRINMDKLLVRAYIAAGFVRDLAMKMGVKDAEETYTCALLHDLGEVAVAYFLPDEYIELGNLNNEGLLPPEENEIAVLGATFSTIGRELAESWEFSSKVTATMETSVPKITGQITKPHDLNKVLAHVSSKIVGSLYNDTPANDGDFNVLMYDLSKATGLSLKKLEDSLSDSFSQSCELAKTYGLSANKLLPAIGESGDEKRDKLARQFSYNISSQSTSSAETPRTTGANKKTTHTEQVSTGATGSGTTKEVVTETGLNAELQLQYIQEITSLITDSAKLNTVLIKVLEGVHSALGFSRVVLCLLNMNRTAYVGRIAIGTDKDEIKEFFTRKVDPKTDIFSRVAIEGQDVIISDVNDKRWAKLISDKYRKNVGANCFVSASLRSGMKPLGFIYADLAHSNIPITAEQQRGFTQFVAQARLALQTCR